MALDEIIAHKRALLAHGKARMQIHPDGLMPAKKSFRSIFKKGRSAFICEIKFASPSMGTIGSHRDPIEIADIYSPFASAISVLADEKYFGGSYDFVRKVSAHIPHPVLCKDVVVSPLQVLEARHHGADAVLLMLAVLRDDEYLACQKAARDLAMDVICEVHTESEMERAQGLGAHIIGINNRDLKTLAVDLETSEKLIKKVPRDALVILESGFAKRSEIKRFSERADGFLIGTSLMRSARPDLAIREILFGRVKICGFRYAEDARLAYECGAYYGGLNLSRLSKRFVSVDEADAIKRGNALVWGGVFVDQAIAEIADAVAKLDLRFVQLHGDEGEGFIADLKKALPDGCEVWKALRVKGDRINVHTRADRVLLDAFDQGVHGGTGRSFDWRMLQELRGDDRFILAGGINPDNASPASEFYLHALDIASGVEDESPGKKSIAKLRDLFFKLRP